MKRSEAQSIAKQLRARKRLLGFTQLGMVEQINRLYGTEFMPAISLRSYADAERGMIKDGRVRLVLERFLKEPVA